MEIVNILPFHILNIRRWYREHSEFHVRITTIQTCDLLVETSFVLYTMAIWEVRGITLLLRVGALWRCYDGHFFEVPPLASDALLTTLHPILENVLLQTVDHFEISFLGSPFSWLEKRRNLMEWDLYCTMAVLMGFQWSTFSKPNTEFISDLAPCDFFGAFPNMERELWGKKLRSDQRSAARNWEVGGAL
jgi:hypothetical protein